MKTLALAQSRAMWAPKHMVSVDYVLFILNRNPSVHMMCIDRMRNFGTVECQLVNIDGIRMFPLQEL